MIKHEKEIVVTQTEKMVANIYCDICGSKIQENEKWVRVDLYTFKGDGVSESNGRIFYCNRCTSKIGIVR